MAATAADTQREIDQLRADMTLSLDEVQRRLRGGLGGVASAETRIRGRRTRDQITRFARENATALGFVAASVASAAAAYGGYTLLSALQERRKPHRRVERGLNNIRARMGTRVQKVQSQTQRVREHGLLVKAEPQNGGYLRISGVQLGAAPDNRRKQTTMVKKLVWTGLVSVLMALVSVVARRLAESAWRATVHEAPPESAGKAAA